MHRTAPVTIREATLTEFVQDVSAKPGRKVERVWVGYNANCARPQYIYRNRRGWRLACGCWDGPLEKAGARIRDYWGHILKFRDEKLSVLAHLRDHAKKLDAERAQEAAAVRSVDKFLTGALRKIGKKPARGAARALVKQVALGASFRMGARGLKAAR